MMQCLCPCMRAGTNAESSNLLEAPSADQFAPLEDAKLLGGGATPGSVAANAMKRAWLGEAGDLASQCFICGVEFGVLVDSRHHCRRCGNTFCAKCSQGRAPLLLGVKTPERLCGVLPGDAGRQRVRDAAPAAAHARHDGRLPPVGL
ncbi:hypothetical protein JL720_13880 [Aureococcus anophagefferens]|nr:hypothetical protein JL720_13880 [Aureococcus anophagefferens]